MSDAKKIAEKLLTNYPGEPEPLEAVCYRSLAYKNKQVHAKAVEMLATALDAAYSAGFADGTKGRC